jgi:rRNA-processing protein FCF1
MGIGTRTAITDTGPPLHLCEINQERQIALFELLIVSQFVRDELANHNVWERLKRLGLNLRVEVVAESSLASLKSIAGIERLSNADLSVWFLARTYKNALILTDDLALRRVLENEGFLVVECGNFVSGLHGGTNEQSGTNPSHQQIVHGKQPLPKRRAQKKGYETAQSN